MGKETPQADFEFSERYDPEDDVYYVTFKTGEPSCVVEYDDILMFEMGLFSKMPTGFRILNFKKNQSMAAKFKVTLNEIFQAKVREANLTAERDIELRGN